MSKAALALVLASLMGLIAATAGAKQPARSDVGAVLRAVAKHYCAEYKPDTPVLSAKISILKDGLDSREMLLEYSRDQAAVDQYFTVNRQGLELPADVNYGCFRLSHGNGGRFGLSFPTFSRAGDTAFVYFEKFDAHGEIYVVMKMSGRWQVTKRLGLWVS